MFDLDGAIFGYLRARKTAPEDDIIRAVEAREEEAFGDEPRDGIDIPLRLFELVTAGRLRWRDPPGGDAGGTLPLLYTLTPR